MPKALIRATSGGYTNFQSLSRIASGVPRVGVPVEVPVLGGHKRGTEGITGVEDSGMAVVVEEVAGGGGTTEEPTCLERVDARELAPEVTGGRGTTKEATCWGWVDARELALSDTGGETPFEELSTLAVFEGGVVLPERRTPIASLLITADAKVLLRYKYKVNGKSKVFYLSSLKKSPPRIPYHSPWEGERQNLYQDGL